VSVLENDAVFEESRSRVWGFNEKSAKKGACIDPHGYDAGKKMKGKKRHMSVDTLGLLLLAVVSADVQDREGGNLLLATGMFPFLEKLFADSAYQGRYCKWACLKPRSSNDPIKPRIRAVTQALDR
jgi:hypothetical protein